MFKEMGVKIFYIGECREGPKKTTVMIEETEKVLYDMFTNQKKDYFLSLCSYLWRKKSHVG